MRTRGRVHPWLLVASLAAPASLAGCATWRPQGLAPRVVIERDRPNIVRLTRADSSHLVLRAPRVARDSIHGLAAEGESVVALADVSYVSLQRSNGAMKAALVGLGVAGGVIALLAATWN